MITHSSRCQWAGLEQDGIRHAHLANVVQQRSASEMSQFILRKTHRPPQLHRRFGHALGVAFRLLVAQIHGARPALDGGVVGQ